MKIANFRNVAGEEGKGREGGRGLINTRKEGTMKKKTNHDVHQHERLRVDVSLLVDTNGLDVGAKSINDLLGFQNLCIKSRLCHHVLDHNIPLGPHSGQEAIDGLIGNLTLGKELGKGAFKAPPQGCNKKKGGGRSNWLWLPERKIIDGLTQLFLLQEIVHRLDAVVNIKLDHHWQTFAF